MSKLSVTSFVLFAVALSTLALSVNGDRSFRFRNNCNQTIWVGALNNPGRTLPVQGGWALAPAQQYTIDVSDTWAGRFWGRTGCTFDSNGNGACVSGDCGSKLACAGAGGAPPATLMEFTLSGASGLDFYDVSLVDGYNLPVKIAAFGTAQSGDPLSCGTISCVQDLNKICPLELQQHDANGNVVGCMSACERFNTDEYCCRNAFGTPDACPPTDYSKLFKDACPTAYSYAYDDPSSTYTCVGGSYEMTFCPF